MSNIHRSNCPQKKSVDHAVVAVGLDDRFIYLNDPAFPTAPIQVERDELYLAWLDWKLAAAMAKVLKS